MQLADLLPQWLRKSSSPTGTIRSASELMRELLRGGGASKSGAAVNWETALRVGAFFACARVIADGLAQVPLKLYRESADGTTRAPAKDHPLYDVLHRRPNEWQTSFEYREMIALHLVFTGRHHSFINRVRGDVVELIPFEPGTCVTKCADDGTLTYEVRTRSGKTQIYPAEAIWHIKGPSWNGWEGLDTVRQAAREALGLAIATEEAHALLHANGVQTTGTYSVEGKLSLEQYTQLRKFIVENNAGANRGLPMIIDNGAKWLQQAMTGVDAQHLETRRFQVEEICRALRVMPIMVGSNDKSSTYASAEQMFLAHVVHTLSPWYERLEQSIDVNLLTKADRAAGVYAKHVVAGLLRGATKDRAEYYSRALGSGGAPAWMTQDEIRGLEEMNPMGGAAAALPIPANAPANKPAADDPAADQSADPGA